MSNIQPEELRALVQRIINSGELGRSRTYSEILLYLAECAISGQNPKEMAIALDVLGRETDFDVGKDSIVRVHIYHLRNKLKAYFSKYGRKEKYHLDIPKGQYVLTAVQADEIADEARSLTGKPLQRQALTPWLAVAAIVLLGLNLLLEFGSDTGNQNALVTDAVFAELGPWKEILDDQLPVLILVGDYYIFGEVNERGDVARLVREFDVNSAQELTFLQDMKVEGAEKYFDIGLNYVPSSIPLALESVMAVLLPGKDPSLINVKMVSEYTTADLANNHIIYLGFLSGLQELYNLMFVGSDLEVGATYDELSNLKTGDYYLSNSGLSGTDSYQDFGLLATFPTPNGHQVTMLAGMRDESLINMAQQATSPTALREIQQELEITAEETRSYEALFEVFGFDNTNFESNLIYTSRRDINAVSRFFGN